MEQRVLPFTKMHGCGNDYVVVDAFHHTAEDPAGLARAACDRRRGVGADGLILVLPSTDSDVRMQMFNPDGSEAEMCGNGLRCMALFAVGRGLVPGTDMAVETAAGRLHASVAAAGAALPAGAEVEVTVDMGAPRLERSEIPMEGAAGRVVDEPLEVGGGVHALTAVSMGNPHAVLFVEDVDSAPVESLGAGLEHHAAFPNRTNVAFVQVLSRNAVRQRTWERGVGETLACGTGACAAAVAGVLAGRTEREIDVHLRGGDLHVLWAEDDRVRLSGPAVEVFEGLWPAD